MRLFLNPVVLTLLAAGIGLAALSAWAAADRKPPVAAKKPKHLEKHGDVRIDDYFWLKERDSKEVLDHLKAENAYTAAVMRHTEKLQDELFQEMKGRIKKDDASVPYKDGPYYYYFRYEKGKEYQIHCRKKGSLDAPEEIIFDENEAAEGHAYYSMIGPLVSPDHKRLAFAEDFKGRRLYTIRVKDLAAGEFLPDSMENADGSMAWAANGEELFYVVQDTKTLRSDRVYRRELGRKRDTLVYREHDETYSLGVSRTRSGAFVVLGAYSTLATEMLVLESDRPRDPFRVFLPRKRGHEYFVQHGGDRWYVLTNHGAKNFRLMETLADGRPLKTWKEVVPHRPEVLLDDVEAFQDYLALEEKENGLTQLRIFDRKTGKSRRVGFRDPAYSVAVGTNEEYDATNLRYEYESLTTPQSWYDHDMGTGKDELRKRREVPGGYDPDLYRSERLFATAPDGRKVPVSLVYKKGIKRNGKNPVLMTGYGAYGSSFDPYFSVVRLSILDRGFVFAIAHIRGGSDLGRPWYEDGRQLKKKNSFTDFIACGEHLVRNRYTAPEHLYAEGGSAGGLLMGAVLNMRPELFNGALVDVAFVDVITTMLDPDIPLTTGEYDEWGDPNKKKFYDYMRSYSPYDNIEAKAYPNILATTGLNDSQVQYWEPAKWVAKLREHKTDGNRLLLKTNMDVGHGGASGRFEALKQYALQYAFLLDLEGIRN